MTRPEDISPALWEQAEILTDQFRHIEDDREFVARILQADRVPRVEAIGLTETQAQALSFIQSYQTEHGFSPSYDEIGAEIGLKKGQVHYVIHRLSERGAISFVPAKARSISILVPGAPA